ncbi:hypothetical protein CANARDRAFT_29575 [[Candida] arabinofermentans NRRL YB-2248]|uniref:Uncharacterized protein n=1 Tax=[Candida] arabinofermentans NRRL YB-2248 TaxID=983967 RepID=A0A1E4SWF5_9ASCO|nr:hypothetical protein CANARDRAFT_29575 [[Candida] arabinofermentans NRRL YB-2248]
MKVTKLLKKEVHPASSGDQQAVDEKLELTPTKPDKPETKKQSQQHMNIVNSFRIPRKQQQQTHSFVAEPIVKQNDTVGILTQQQQQQIQQQQPLDLMQDRVDMTQHSSYSKKLWRINRFKSEDVEKQSKMVQNAQHYALTSDTQNTNKYGFKKTNVKPKINKEGTPTEFLFVNCAPTRTSDELPSVDMNSSKNKPGTSTSAASLKIASTSGSDLEEERKDEEKKQSSTTAGRVSRLFRSRSVKREEKEIGDFKDAKDKDKDEVKESGSKDKEKSKKEKEKDKDREKEKDKDKDKEKEKDKDKDKDKEVKENSTDDFSFSSIRIPFTSSSSSSSSTLAHTNTFSDNSKKLTLKRLYRRKTRNETKLKILPIDTAIIEHTTSRAVSVGSALSTPSEFSMVVNSTNPTLHSAGLASVPSSTNTPFTPITPMLSTNSSLASIASTTINNNIGYNTNGHNNNNNFANIYSVDYFAYNNNSASNLVNSNSSTPLQTSRQKSSASSSSSTVNNLSEDPNHQQYPRQPQQQDTNSIPANYIDRHRSNSTNSVAYSEASRAKHSNQQNLHHLSYSPIVNTPLQNDDIDVGLADYDNGYDDQVEISSINTSNTKKLKALKRSNSIVSINSISSQSQYPPSNGINQVPSSYGQGIMMSTTYSPASTINYTPTSSMPSTFANNSRIVSRNRSLSVVSTPYPSPTIVASSSTTSNQSKSPLRRSISQHGMQPSNPQPQQLRIRAKSTVVDPLGGGVTSYPPLFDPQLLSHPVPIQQQQRRQMQQQLYHHQQQLLLLQPQPQLQSQHQQQQQLQPLPQPVQQPLPQPQPQQHPQQQQQQQQSPGQTKDQAAQADEEEYLKNQQIIDQFFGSLAASSFDDQPELSYEELKKQHDELVHSDTPFYLVNEQSMNQSHTVMLTPTTPASGAPATFQYSNHGNSVSSATDSYRHHSYDTMRTVSSSTTQASTMPFKRNSSTSNFNGGMIFPSSSSQLLQAQSQQLQIQFEFQSLANQQQQQQYHYQHQHQQQHQYQQTFPEDGSPDVLMMDTTASPILDSTMYTVVKEEKEDGEQHDYDKEGNHIDSTHRLSLKRTNNGVQKTIIDVDPLNGEYIDDSNDGAMEDFDLYAFINGVKETTTL